ncbi:MAG: glycosyltransferase [Rickettsiaceae bacterium]|nr:MAG: glycosyltransferase [Rickettsiaceae bacterium]
MTIQMNPLVSIIIPVYNGADYISQALDSSLNQTYKNIEVIVVNDGSNDDGKTEAIVSEYGNKIRYFSKSNGGVASALNLAIKNMKGAYFSWLSHDDVYHKNKIECQIKALRLTNNPDTIIYNNFEYVDANLNYISSADPHKLHSIDKLNNSLYPLLKSLINGCALLIPVKYFKEISLFDENLVTTQDYDLWFKFLRIAPIRYDPTIVVKSRVHPQQGSKTIHSYVKESNELWSNFVNQVTEQEMISVHGSRYLFLIRMIEHLRYGPYEETLELISNKIQPFINSIKITIILTSGNVTDNAKSIQSVLEQTHRNFELLIIKHNSNIIDYQHIDDQRIKIININNNFSQLQNLLIDNISGDYTAFLKAGDLFCRKKLFIQINHMLTEDLLFSYGAYTQIDNNNKPIRNIYLLSFLYQYLPTWLYIELIAVSTLIVKSNILKDIYAKHQLQKNDITKFLVFDLSEAKYSAHLEVLSQVHMSLTKSISIFTVRALSKIIRIFNQRILKR